MRLVDWLEERAHDDLSAPGMLGWAWATVDLERALSEAGKYGSARWAPVEDELLGARGLRLVDVAPAVLLLEPSTEGRLAGWLARNGEGEAAAYFEATQELRQARNTALGRPGRLVNAALGPPNGTRLEILVTPPLPASER
jgi:hypothetical protein